MSVRKFRNSWWVDFRFEKARYRKRSPENSRTGAAAYELVLRQRLAHGQRLDASNDKPDSSSTTFKEFAEKWLATYVENNNKYTSRLNKRYTFRRHLVPFFGGMKLDEIGSFKIEEFKALKRGDGLAPQSVNAMLLILGKCLRMAQEWGARTTEVPRIKLLKCPPSKSDFLTQMESEQLLKSITNLTERTMVLLALRTGLRIGEITGLRWPDIDFDRELLTVRRSIVYGIVSTPKSNKERHIPLTPEILYALKVMPKSQGYVFPARNGAPLSHKMASGRLKSWCVVAGLRKIGWHMLRHSFASQMVAVNVPLRAVQELLGHANIATTMRYSHLAPSTLKEAVNILDKGSVGMFGQRAVNAT